MRMLLVGSVLLAAGMLPALAAVSAPACLPSAVTDRVLNTTTAEELASRAAASAEQCVSACCARADCQLVTLTNATCLLLRCPPEAGCGWAAGTPPPHQLVWTLSRETAAAAAATTSSAGAEAVSSAVQRCRPAVSASCPAQQRCTPLSNSSQLGVCRCGDGAAPAQDGSCGPPPPPQPTATSLATSTLRPLVVSVSNQTIRLPEDSATLQATVLPPPTSEQQYQYEWRLLSGAAEAATISDARRQQVRLDGLSAGVYVFQLLVSADGAAGTTFANVTVKPAPRVNVPPVAVVSLPDQTLHLPNSKALLDGSASRDDLAAGLSYHWEMVQAPLDYHQELESSPTLQLENLIPGNYTIRLTVEDADGATDSSDAHITVLKALDYAPQANAGEDVIVYLPNNAVTLNGSGSLDDKGIVAYEWTKAPGSEQKAVDMQDTHTPYLRLANLEQGVYTFELKVADAADHTSTDTVVVLVKSQANTPPEAVAGSSQRLTLPRSWALLDGSASRDDLRVVSWLWQQVSGPAGAKIVNATKPAANATGLTRGAYTFRLTVRDDASNSTALTNVTIVQATNQAPVADAGGDLMLHLPVSVVTLNGSRSSDDVAVVRWRWQRDPSSLAAGRVLAETDASPSLQLVDMVAGQYRFQLAVWDEQGASSTDAVSVVIQPDPDLGSHVQLELDIPLNRWTEAQKVALRNKVALAVPSSGEVRVRLLGWTAAPRSGHLQLQLMAEDVSLRADAQPQTRVLPGPELVAALRQRLAADPSALEHTVLRLETVTCQNECSGHGSCQPASRRCQCHRFWTENVFKRYAGGDSNCEWSVLYVIIIGFSLAAALCAAGWAAVCLLRRWWGGAARARRARYAPVGSLDIVEMRPKNGLSGGAVLASETDSESEPLFEASAPRRPRATNKRRKRNGLLRPAQKSGKKM